MLKITPETWLKRFHHAHHDAYGYEKVKFGHGRTRIEIWCKKCKLQFWKATSEHAGAAGCPACGLASGANKRRRTTEEFAIDAAIVHTDLYDYTHAKYELGSVPVEIVCPAHGSFWQTPYAHISGNGCKKCTRGEVWNINDFLEKAIEVHGGKYNYEFATYTTAKNLIKIICKEHGMFEQQAHLHLSGSGCPKCGIRIVADSKVSNLEEFIKTGRKVHDSKYIYTDTIYTRSNELVKITCPVHGVFEQKPNHHLRGQGCPRCVAIISKPEIEWLDHLGVKIRQMPITVDGSRFNLDGYNPETRTAFEFCGDFWHGNPAIYDPSDINQVAHVSFGELHKKTLVKIGKLESAGFNIIGIWESDWAQLKNTCQISSPFLNSNQKVNTP